MKNNKQKDQAYLHARITEAVELDFDYNDVKPRINTLQYEKDRASVPAPKQRLHPQILAVACSFILITSTVGLGSFIMSQRGAVVEPPTSVTETPTSHVTESQPADERPILYPEDILLWQGETYIRTNLMATEGEVGAPLGQIISEEADSGSGQSIRDNPQTAIAEHLEDGTPFHQVTDTENCIAVHTEDGYIIYQRQLTPDTTEP